MVSVQCQKGVDRDKPWFSYSCIPNYIYQYGILFIAVYVETKPRPQTVEGQDQKYNGATDRRKDQPSYIFIQNVACESKPRYWAIIMVLFLTVLRHLHWISSVFTQLHTHLIYITTSYVIYTKCILYTRHTKCILYTRHTNDVFDQCTLHTRIMNTVQIISHL